jgi:hypothetical protein
MGQDRLASSPVGSFSDFGGPAPFCGKQIKLGSGVALVVEDILHPREPLADCDQNINGIVSASVRFQAADLTMALACSFSNWTGRK